MQGGSVTIDAERFLALEKTVRDRLAEWRLRLTPFFFVLVHVDVEAHSSLD